MRRCWGGWSNTFGSAECWVLGAGSQDPALLTTQHSAHSTARRLRPRRAGRRRSRSARGSAAFAGSERRTRDGRRDTDCFCVLEVRIDRSDDDARFNRDQVDADEGDANPRVDDDTFVEDPVEYVNETCAAWCTFDSHGLPAFPLSRLPGREATIVEFGFQFGDPRLQRVVLAGRRKRGRCARIEPIRSPPVDADRFCFVDGANHEAQLDGQKLDIGERDFDVACDDQPLVENFVEDVDQSLRLARLDRHGPEGYRNNNSITPTSLRV